MRRILKVTAIVIAVCIGLVALLLWWASDSERFWSFVAFMIFFIGGLFIIWEWLIEPLSAIHDQVRRLEDMDRRLRHIEEMLKEQERRQQWRQGRTRSFAVDEDETC